MKKRTKVLLASATLLATFAAAQSVKADAIHVSSDKNWLMNNENQVVITHGFNAVQKAAPYFPMNEADGITDADAAWLQAHGFNAIRLGTLFEGIMPQKGVIDQNYLKGIERVVNLFQKHGIYTILDFHQDVYNVRWGGDGFPDWAVDTNGLGDVPGLTTFPIAYQNPATQKAFDNFWNNTKLAAGDKEGLMDYYIDAQKAIASYFAKSSDILGLELINEPNPGSQTLEALLPTGSPSFDAKMTASYAKMSAGIRSVAPTMPILEEPTLSEQSGSMTYLGAANDANTIYAFHDYNNFDNPAAMVGLDSLFKNILGDKYYNVINGLTEPNQWYQAKNQAERIGGPMLLTEFGATDDIGTLKGVTQSANANLTGWFYWNYKILGDNSTSGPGVETMFKDDSELSSVKADKLKALEQTYAQDISGTPTAMNFNQDTGAFSLDYTANDSKAPTTIYVAKDHYPANGYDIWVTGATIRSRNASQVTIAPTTPGTQVHVSITAKRADEGLSGDITPDTDSNNNSSTNKSATKDNTSNKNVPVYRLYNPNSGEHLYTTSPYEYKADAAAGWKAEGVVWQAPKSGQAVYRLYNAHSGEHFYTTSSYEYNSVAQSGWQKEGVVFYSSTAKQVPIYREFNPNAKGAGSHFYTTSPFEYNANAAAGWKKEGVAFYGAAK